MPFDNLALTFPKHHKENKCRVFESSTPPIFDEGKIRITESRSGANIEIDGNVESFKKDQRGNFRLRVCKK